MSRFLSAHQHNWLCSAVQVGKYLTDKSKQTLQKLNTTQKTSNAKHSKTKLACFSRFLQHSARNEVDFSTTLTSQHGRVTHLKLTRVNETICATNPNLAISQFQWYFLVVKTSCKFAQNFGRQANRPTNYFVNWSKEIISHNDNI